MTDQPGWTSPAGDAEPGPGMGYGYGYGAGYAPGYGPAPGYGYQPPPLPVAPRPGVIPLRPLGIGEILDGAISTVRAHWRVMLGLSAVVVTVSQLLGFGLQAMLLGGVATLDTADPATLDSGQVTGLLAGTLGAAAVLVAVTWLGQTVLNGMLTAVVGRAVLGQPVTLGDAWTRVRPLLWRLLGLALVVNVLAGLGLLVCLLPGVFLFVQWVLAAPALVLERGTIRTSMRRSWTLVSGSWWRTFGVVALTYLITQLISSAFSFPVTFVAGVFAPGALSGTGGSGSLLGFYALATLAGIVAGIITTPFTASVYALLYVDQRMRREALDLELMRSAGVAPSAPPAPPPYPGPPAP